jgi:hypothetical protein
MYNVINKTADGIRLIGRLKLKNSKHVKTSNYYSLSLSKDEVRRIVRIYNQNKELGVTEVRLLDSQDNIKIGYSSSMNGKDIKWGEQRSIICELGYINLHVDVQKVQVILTLQDLDGYLESEEIPLEDIKSIADDQDDFWEDISIKRSWYLSDIASRIFDKFIDDLEPSFEACNEIATMIEEAHDAEVGINNEVIDQTIEVYLCNKFEKLPKPKEISIDYYYNGTDIMLDDYALILPEGYNAEDYKGYKDADIFYYFSNDDEIIGDHGEFTVTAFEYEQI